MECRDAGVENTPIHYQTFGLEGSYLRNFIPTVMKGREATENETVLTSILAAP